jgi:molybdopterin/thiamine biosynthesis adenylyltransferase
MSDLSPDLLLGATDFGINSRYELLFLSDGTIYFSDLHGSNLKLSGPPTLISFFRRIDAGENPSRVLADIEAVQGSDHAARVRMTFAQLVDEGIYRRKLSLAPASITTAKLKRFRAQLDWLVDIGGENKACRAFERIATSSIACIGLGGAGSLCAMMLAAFGIGKLTLVDGDEVAESNLVRQMFYTVDYAIQRRKKADVLAARVLQLTSYTCPVAISRNLQSLEQTRSIVRGHDLVIMTADAPRILINRVVNDACIAEQVPLISSFFGQIGPLFVPGYSHCFACLESTWRAEAGREHDMVVEALQVRPTREYPSMVSGPVQTADALFLEAVAFITELLEPLTFGAILRLRRLSQDRELIKLSERCSKCGLFEDSPWSSFVQRESRLP